MSSGRKFQHFRGAENFRVKVALSLISLKPIRITHIRNKSLDPGVNEAEISVLKLIDEITNGTVSKINDTGTIVTFSPGVLIGGEIDFDCSLQRGIGYFLELLLILAPFCKQGIEAKLHGVTNCLHDPSVEMIKHTWLPVYNALVGPSAAATLKIEVSKRGLAPNGGGEVQFISKPCSSILPIEKISVGKIFRIRGIAWTCRVSSAYGYKLVAAAKTLLNRFLSDVYITLDHKKDESAGLSPGFGLTLWAETKTGATFSGESMSEPQSPNAAPVDADTVGRTAASRLLDQVYFGGFVDFGAQSLPLILMACEGGRNASQLAMGPPTSYSVSTLRLIRQLLGVTFNFDYRQRTSPEEVMKEEGDTTKPSSGQQQTDSSSEPPLLIATCFGSGIQNVSRSVR
ncbi:unnamed protein product [Calicophoron daubneyi]|uniref:RNA 3'-terminal phosphate cyclase-like protein n=1 Tax=Calicophoron daubneyi TaxID=300641 RepID=A0AAV2TTX0_CALDB